MNLSFKKWIESAVATSDYDLQNKYDHFNQLLFNGELPKIPIEYANIRAGGIVHCTVVRDPKNLPNPRLVRMGLVDKYHGGKIKEGTHRMQISKVFKHSEQGLDAILIHEMIHVYFNIKGLFGENHGIKFAKMARDLSTKVGFEIPLTDNVERYGLTDETKLKTVGAQLIYKKDGSYSFCLMTDKTIQANLSALIERWTYMVTYNYAVKTEFYIITSVKGTELANSYKVQRKDAKSLNYYPLKDTDFITDLKTNGKLLAVVPSGVSEGVLPRRKECSAVAIQAITQTPVEDVQRTLTQTVFAIEDMGFERDTSPTRVWGGKPVKELRAGSDIPLGLASIAGTPEHEAHVMPIVNGKLLNAAGWLDEPISVVIAFKKKAGT